MTNQIHEEWKSKMQIKSIDEIKFDELELLPLELYPHMLEVGPKRLNHQPKRNERVKEHST